MIDHFGIHVPTTTIRLARKRLGWTHTKSRYCQLIRVPNQIAKLEFCRRCLADNDTFENVIFTGESTIMMDSHGRISFRKRGKLAKLKPRPKHPYKVHVWAGISKKGPTNIVIFTGIMKKEFYVHEVLAKGLLPFVNKVFPDGNYKFQQDNDPKHKSKSEEYLLPNISFQIFKE